MHKLAIIDDEYEHVQGIKNFIAWDRYGIEVCGIAYDGRDGLELFKKSHPDIALIDIQMPFINGLTLIEEVNRLSLNTQIIIMSGHDNFEYARKAIELNANNYLLKPCSAEEILQAVLKAKNLFVEETKKKQLLSQYQALFNQYATLFKDRLLVDLLDEKLRNPSAFFEDASNYEINLKNTNSCVAVFRLEERESLYARSGNEEMDCLMLGIAEEAKRQIPANDHLELVIKEDDLVLIASREPFDYEWFTGIIGNVYLALSDTFDFPFTVGIGKPVPTPLLSGKSYKQALAALENSLFMGSRKMAEYDDQLFKESIHYLYPFSEEKKILQAIEAGDSSLVRESVESFFGSFGHLPAIDNGLAKKMGLSLLNSIMRFCSEKNIDTPELQQLIFKSFDSITAARSFELLKNVIIRILEDIINQIQIHVPVNKFIQLALNYIHSNYSRDISLKMVADELYLSPAYFSFLFKQKMKTNFIDYLNSYRVLMARDLLKDIRLKSYEIAYQVGFQDEKYFFKLFKKYTGLTASQYRESLRVFDSRP